MKKHSHLSEHAHAHGETVGTTGGGGSIPRHALQATHVELSEANAFILAQHRHHGRIQGHRFSLGASLSGRLVGVIVVGRPVGGTHQRDWVEVTRCCTDGTPNACSLLYSAAARAAKALGFERIQTYVLKAETGASLRASGWRFDRLSHPAGWHHDGGNEKPGRPARKTGLREAHLVRERKQLWFRELRP